MIPSAMITVAADGERLMCGGFFIGETVRFGNFELIAEYFGDLSLSPRRGDSQWDTIPVVGHDRGLYRVVRHHVKRGGELRPPLSQEARHGRRAPVTITTWIENAPAT
jgi:hypothetical protein